MCKKLGPHRVLRVGMRRYERPSANSFFEFCSAGVVYADRTSAFERLAAPAGHFAQSRGLGLHCLINGRLGPSILSTSVPLWMNRKGARLSLNSAQAASFELSARTKQPRSLAQVEEHVAEMARKHLTRTPSWREETHNDKHFVASLQDLCSQSASVLTSIMNEASTLSFERPVASPATLACWMSTCLFFLQRTAATRGAISPIAPPGLLPLPQRPTGGDGWRRQAPTQLAPGELLAGGHGIDFAALSAKLPTGHDPESKERRKKLFRKAEV